MCTAVPAGESLLYAKRQCLGMCTALPAVETLLYTKRVFRYVYRSANNSGALTVYKESV
jgi:hypothetical protein